MESMLYQGHGFLGDIKHFLDGREIVEEPRSGRACTSKNGQKCDQSEGSREV